MDNYNKYIKYKNKYIYLKKQIGGLPSRKIEINTGPVTDQTLGDCIKELIVGAYSIYSSILRLPYNTTIICGGQSPSYYCLAMMHFHIYNFSKANIIILPHSKGGVKSKDPRIENIKYCTRLREKGINLNRNVIIIDGVHSGVGILALQSALEHCFPGIYVQKYSINYAPGISEIPVDKEYYFRCEPTFSDVFPRLITSYYPSDFDNADKFINEFTLEGNPIAEMIIDIAKNYPDINVEDTDWFKFNNEITPAIILMREELERKRLKSERFEREELESERLEREREQLESEGLERERKIVSTGQTFAPIIKANTEGNKIYECPTCGSISGTMLIITHKFNCTNKYKNPQE